MNPLMSLSRNQRRTTRTGTTAIRRSATVRQWPVSGSGFEVRGTEALFKVIKLRAYLKNATTPDVPAAGDELVPIGTDYDETTMYLYPTWDWPRNR